MRFGTTAHVCMAYSLSLAGGLIGCAHASGPAEPAADRLQAIAARGELRVCSTGDYRPFTYYEPAASRWSGIDVDMADDLARRLGVRRTMVRTTWKSLMSDFTTKCDIAVGGISITPERAKVAFYSDAYLNDGKVPITRCGDAARFGALEQINQPDVRVIVNPGGTNEQFVRAHLPKANIIVYPDNNTIHGEIVAGRADVMITDGAEARWQAKQNPALCAVRPQQPLTFSQKAYLLPLGDTVFQSYVNQWLGGARRDGTYDRIAKPWLG
ncbi:transporter substrate-binding domain-containing protein [Pendulispora albinea]|uniref:Transporter substrate-binding domain-containing protein n=1 Tax=Pendulispora albinea TaxID=2741071 RepID=A0ABZ2LPI9_9BACT